MFKSTLDLRLAGRKGWTTLAPLVYDSKVAKCVIEVPVEFVTDLASVPRLPLAYWVAGGRATGPAVIHDFLYQTPTWDDRQLADAILYEAMGCEQVSLGFEAENLVMKNLIWSAVRAGGWHAWNNHKRVETLNPIWSKEGWPGGP